jgi:hypothetical protein
MAITRYIGKDTPPESNPTKIDRNAPAGSENSLGAERVRDGRTSTDDNVVEAMDEETPTKPVTSGAALPAFVSPHLLCYRWFQQINRS